MSSSVVEPKRGADVGRVLVEVLVENYSDVQRAERGEISEGQIRRATTEALVDSGATYLCLPKTLVDELGLTFVRWKEARTAAGPIRLNIYGVARTTVQGRDCLTEVMALPDKRQALLGQIPLEQMDWWVDVKNQRLVGNPEHGGEWMAEV